MTQTGMSYRKSAIEGASPIGLAIALFDTLVGDLRRAASALRINDIEARCRELNHAALVLGQLESWVDVKNGGEPALQLCRFYAYLRSKMMEASVKKSAAILETQIEMILHVRSSWQQRDMASQQEVAKAAEVTPEAEPKPSTPLLERVAMSFSA
jgi:flagellar protein FliS